MFPLKGNMTHTHTLKSETKGNFSETKGNGDTHTLKNCQKSSKKGNEVFGRYLSDTNGKNRNLYFYARHKFY